MKFTNKFMVVPYIKPIENIEDTKINQLDQEMSAILDNKTIDFDSKIKLYNQTLSRFIKNYDKQSNVDYKTENQIKLPEVQLAETKKEIIEPIVKEEIDIKKEIKKAINKTLEPKIKKIAVDAIIPEMKKLSRRKRISPSKKEGQIKIVEDEENDISNYIDTRTDFDESKIMPLNYAPSPRPFGNDLLQRRQSNRKTIQPQRLQVGSPERRLNKKNMFTNYESKNF